MNATTAILIVAGLYLLAKGRVASPYQYGGVLGTSPQGFSVQGPGFALSKFGNMLRFGFGQQTAPQIPSFQVPPASLGPAPDSVDNPPNFPAFTPDVENVTNDPGVFSDPSGLLPDTMVPSPMSDPLIFYDPSSGGGGSGLPFDPSTVFGA